MVRVVEGEVLDVAVDLRKGSESFGKHESVLLSSQNKRQLFIPKGFAHGFVVLSKQAIFIYKVDNPYSKESESGILFSDPSLNIDGKIREDELIISEKDKQLKTLNDFQS